MEKIKKYETLIIDLLNSIKGASLDNFVIVDKEKRHYQLLYVGNDNRDRYFSQVRIHFYLESAEKLSPLKLQSYCWVNGARNGDFE